MTTKPLMMLCLIAWVVIYGELFTRLADPATRGVSGPTDQYDGVGFCCAATP
jgi:hypothetical protein